MVISGSVPVDYGEDVADRAAIRDAENNRTLKAEIAVIATEFDNLGPGSCGGEHLKSFYDLVIKLRQLIYFHFPS